MAVVGCMKAETIVEMGRSINGAGASNNNDGDRGSFYKYKRDENNYDRRRNLSWDRFDCDEYDSYNRKEYRDYHREYKTVIIGTKDEETMVVETIIMIAGNIFQQTVVVKVIVRIHEL